MKDFELSVLKNLISTPDYFTKVFNLLEPKYFEDPGTQGIFKLFREYYREYKEQPGIIELATKIKDTSNAEHRKLLAEAIKELNGHNAEFKDINFLLDETVTFIKDALYLEALTIGAEGLERKSDDLKKQAQAILDKRAQIHIDDNISLDFDDVDDIIEHFSTKDIGLLTHHKDLDLRLGCGFLPGTLNVVMAAQGVGKSLMMCDIATSLLKQGKNVLIVSLEMSDYETIKRIYANCLDINITAFTEMPDSDATKEEVRSAYNKAKMSGTLGKLFVKDYPAGSFSSLMLEGLVERFRQERNINFDCVIVDYLGIMKSDLVAPAAGLYSYIKSIGEELRASAKKLGVAVLTCSQLNRSAVNKTDEVDNSAIADSMGTAMTADLIMMILQSEDMKEKAEVVIKITKNRYTGKTDTFMMGVDYDHMRFVSLVQPFKSADAMNQASSYASAVAKSHDKQVAATISHNPQSYGDMDSFLKDLGI